MMTAWKVERLAEHRGIVVVGCGGTGGYVAEGLCRLLINDPERDIILVDHDRVEPHNLLRQNFYEGDVGKYKSVALAERLARRYGREVGYSVLPFSKEIMKASELGHNFHVSLTSDLVIGCVDNASARKAIAVAMKEGYATGWWLDSGNGQHSGQVIIGNAEGAYLKGAFHGNGTVWRLPLPTVQQPSLLIPAPEKEKQPDCAEAVAADEQSPVINRMMADLALTFVHKLLTGSLTWMAAYIDMEAGTLSTVDATPVIVSRLTGLKASELMGRRRRDESAQH